jgi:hypothetical protein
MNPNKINKMIKPLDGVFVVNLYQAPLDNLSSIELSIVYSIILQSDYQFIRTGKNKVKRITKNK